MSRHARTMRLVVPILAVLNAAAATAQEACPPAPDIADGIDRLIAEARAAPDERGGRIAAGGMWELWTQAPDATAQELLDEGMDRRTAFDLEGAVAAFDALVAYCPDYAEGYNQRAFANFLREDYAAVLPDLDRALALSPRHVAALAGRGLTLLALGRRAEGEDAIRAALDLNPWLQERFYIASDGTDL